MVYSIDWCVYTEESLHPLDKLRMIVVYDLLNVVLESVC